MTKLTKSESETEMKAKQIQKSVFLPHDFIGLRAVNQVSNCEPELLET